MRKKNEPHEILLDPSHFLSSCIYPHLFYSTQQQSVGTIPDICIIAYLIESSYLLAKLSFIEDSLGIVK